MTTHQKLIPGLLSMHASSGCGCVPILYEIAKKKAMKVVSTLPLSFFRQKKQMNINTFQNQRSLLLIVIVQNMRAPKISKIITGTQSNSCWLERIVK